jgi:acylphosphatase
VDEVSKRYIVHGRVQGVGFRDSVNRLAYRLGDIRGHVRNLRDGSVEVCVSADAGKVGEIEAFLRRGPPIARVDRLDEAPFDPPERPGRFTILY